MARSLEELMLQQKPEVIAEAEDKAAKMLKDIDEKAGRRLGNKSEGETDIDSKRGQ